MSGLDSFPAMYPISAAIQVEITQMQAQAIFEAACNVAKKGVKVIPEVMIPLVGNVNELADQKQIVVDTAKAVFEKKGIKTDLSAIEKYVDEMLQCVGANQEDFMTEIKKDQSISQADQLYEMQNSDIGTFTHFYRKPPGALGVNTYLALENLRQQQPNQGFDFENVTEEDLAEDRVDRKYLVECQHIHNKVLFRLHQ